MRIGRTLPPAASPIGWKSFSYGLLGIFRGEKEVLRFESELKSYFNKKHCFLVSSGKAALTLILQSLKEQYPDRTDIIIPAYTCYSVPAAIIRAGLRVVLCDIDDSSFDFDMQKLSQLLKRDSSLAVVPTHLFGYPVDVKRTADLARRTGVFVIEDAAQAMGGEWQGEKLGSLGDVSIFSLGRGKAFSTVEGGVILTDNPVLADGLSNYIVGLPSYPLLVLMKLIVTSLVLSILSKPYLFWIPRSLPFLKLGVTSFSTSFELQRFSSFQAGLARGWEAKLNLLLKKRKENCILWATRIGERPFVKHYINLDCSPSLIRFPILIPNQSLREKLLCISEKRGFGFSLAYPDSLDKIPEIIINDRVRDYPGASNIAKSILTLPVHSYVENKDIIHISNVIIKCLENYDE